MLNSFPFCNLNPYFLHNKYYISHFKTGKKNQNLQGEVDKSRFPGTGSLFLKYLQYDAFFLAFRSAMFLLKHSFPLPIMFSGGQS